MIVFEKNINRLNEWKILLVDPTSQISASENKKKALIKILFQGKKILILNQFSNFFFDFEFDENSRKYENFIKNRDFNPRSPSEFFSPKTNHPGR